MREKPKYYESLARTPEEEIEHAARMERIEAFRSVWDATSGTKPPRSNSKAWRAYDLVAFGGAQ